MRKIYLFIVLVLFLALTSNAKSATHKSSSSSNSSNSSSSCNNHFFRTSSNHYTNTWSGPFQIVSDVTYYLYLDTANHSTAYGSEVVVNNQSLNTSQTWYFRKLTDGNYSIFNYGVQGYLTLNTNQTGFVVKKYDGSEYQKFYVRQFWNGYTFNCQINLGYYNYVTVDANGTVTSLYYNGNPATQFFQLVGTAKLDLV